MRTKKQISFPFLLLAAILLLFTFSCRKEDSFSTDPSIQLSFSNDSIIFDTVFTSLGSATHRLMIYNESKSNIKISNIRVEQGSSSAFRINVDGQSGTTFEDMEIKGGDSLYIFARVTIDPTNANNPFVMEDQIRFLTNTNEQSVKLVAWGQNANYILADRIVAGFPPFHIVADSLETTVWTNEKPYVIYGYALINSYGELQINEGTRIYFHKNSGLWSYSDGTLKVYGTRENPVHFSGDRLEEFYKDIPGQWDRIWLMDGRPGHDHEFHNVIIENGFIGIQAESFLRVTENKVILKDVIIQNMTGIGLFTRIYNVDGENMVLGNCGAYSAALTGGGKYDFRQSTVANYWGESGVVRNTPALYVNNFIPDSLDKPIPFPVEFSMSNSIVYGYNKNEFDADMVGGADSIYRFDYAILKTALNLSNTTNYNNILKNEDPLFVDPQLFDYRIDTLSPAIGYGDLNIAATVPFDILGYPRTESADLGAYQFVPGQTSK